MTVLFNSSRPLGRCENLTAVYETYDGDKQFVRGGFADVCGSECDVVVTDEFVQRKRADQTVVMIGHGLTGGKLYGIDQMSRVYTPERCGLVDWYVSSSEHGRAFCASAAGIPIDRCLPLGFPRTDAYFGARKGDGGTVLAEFDRAYLYAPTFRSWTEPKPQDVDWRSIDAQLDDDELLVVKRHMIADGPIAEGRFDHIIEVGNDEPSTAYLIDCDVVITDFSTIVLDGYVLRKPSVLCTHDADEYLAARGMYMDYPSDYGGVTCDTWAQLIERARDAARNGMGAHELACLERTAGACDGHSTERVIGLIESLL